MIRKTLSFILLLATTWSTAVAQTTTSDSIALLEKEMYALFRTTDSAAFFGVTEKLKQAALANGEERLFYRSWGNQAIFASRKISPERAIHISEEIKAHALKHDSKYGVFSSTYVTGSIFSSLGNIVSAKGSFEEAAEYLDRFLPKEDKGPVYTSLSNACTSLQLYNEAKRYAQIVVNDPNSSLRYKVLALDAICRLTGITKNREGFMKAYQERADLIKKMKPDEVMPNETVDALKAYFDGHFALAMEHAKKVPTEVGRYQLFSYIYEGQGNYKDAFKNYQRYVRVRDSIYHHTIRIRAEEYDSQLDVARAENATKEMELRQSQMQLKAQQLEEHHHHIIMLFAALIAVIVIGAMGLIVHRRRRQMLKLKTINQELRTAYENLERTTAAKEHMEGELRVASEIQKAMVPNAFPERDDIDIFASMIPAKQVGGDLYAYALNDDEMYFCVGDVSGKGVPAALFMAQVTRLFRSQATMMMKPAEIANHMNHELSANNETGMFVTMFIGMLDIKTGRLEFCNCGHNPPILINNEHEADSLAAQFLEVESNAPLGLWPDLEYEGQHIDDMRHETLLIYTDGLTEAENRMHEQFGEDSLLTLIEEHHEDDCRTIVNGLRKTVLRHENGAEATDDLTVMCIKLK